MFVGACVWPKPNKEHLDERRILLSEDTRNSSIHNSSVIERRGALHALRGAKFYSQLVNFIRAFYESQFVALDE